MQHRFRSLAPRAVAAAAAALSFNALAHVTLDYQVAPAGSSYRATFKVGHGCAGSPTRQVSVAIPDGVRAPKPMPKPGWHLEVQPTRVTWTAKTREDMLAPTHYDEFVLLARLPDHAGTLYWPVVQVCEQGRHDWTEVPRPGQKLSDLKSPAAALEILPGGGAAGHNH